jgi:hypothetical protein
MPFGEGVERLFWWTALRTLYMQLLQTLNLQPESSSFDVVLTPEHLLRVRTGARSLKGTSLKTMI